MVDNSEPIDLVDFADFVEHGFLLNDPLYSVEAEDLFGELEELGGFTVVDPYAIGLADFDGDLLDLYDLVVETAAA